jgi:CXCXC repeat protein
MQKIIRSALLFVILGVGVVSTAPTQGIAARTTKASAVTTLNSGLCPIINCVPEKVLDPKTCRCVPRP